MLNKLQQHIYIEMKEKNLPAELLELLTKEEIMLFKDLQIKLQELINTL